MTQNAEPRGTGAERSGASSSDARTKIGRMVVYTAVFGGYDFVAAPRLSTSLPADSIDFVCFTDTRSRVPRGWRRVVVSPDLPPNLANRRLKILGHALLAEYDTSLYVDANLAIRNDPRPLAARYLANHAMAIPAHPDRSCVYEEAEACVRSGKSEQADTRALAARYRKSGMPSDFGLTENSFILRRTNDAELTAFLHRWWDAVVRGPSRDQLHLPFLSWRAGYEVAVIDRRDLATADVVRKLPHKRNLKAHRRLAYAALTAHYDRWAGRAVERLLDGYDSAKATLLRR